MTATETSHASLCRWSDLPAEPLKGAITGSLITSERMMIAHVYLKKRDDVPRHFRENAQITYILEGALGFGLALLTNVISACARARSR